MKPYAPLNDCTFLPRVQQAFVDVDARQHDALLAMPTSLGELLNRLTCSPAKISVQFGLTSGSLFDYLPTVTPDEIAAEELRWQAFLERLSTLRGRCQFSVNKSSLRQSVQERFDQVVHAVES